MTSKSLFEDIEEKDRVPCYFSSPFIFVFVVSGIEATVEVKKSDKSGVNEDAPVAGRLPCRARAVRLGAGA